MSPSGFVHSHRRSAHGSWMMHVHPHAALADPLAFVMQDTPDPGRPEGSFPAPSN